MRSRFFRNQDGASLVIVLVFMTIFGLIAGGLLTETGASVRYTTSVTNYEKKVYAADAGVALGIQQLQQHNDICPDTGSNETLETVNVNGFDTGVSCEVTSGSTEGGLGYAIITRSDQVDSLIVQGGADAKLVNGPVYVTGGTGNTAGEFDAPGMQITNGNFRQNTASGCTSTQLDRLTLDSGYRYSCQAAAPADVVPVAPTKPDAARSSETVGACTYFYPGTYTAAPALGPGTNYFASGVYYFNFSGVWDVTEVLYGGQPTVYEEVQYDPMPGCASDDDAITAAGGNVSEVSGTGAQFVFGGDTDGSGPLQGAKMRMGNGSQVEIFTRTLDGTAGTRTASFVAVPDSWASAGWTESTDSTSTAESDEFWVLDFANGSNPDSVIHGLVYAPEQNARLYSTNGVDAAVLGGIIVWELELQSSASGSGLTVSATDGKPEPRHIVITATAPPSPGTDAGRQITSTAVVEIANDGDLTVRVESWRTRGVTESL